MFLQLHVHTRAAGLLGLSLWRSHIDPHAKHQRFVTRTADTGCGLHAAGHCSALCTGHAEICCSPYVGTKAVHLLPLRLCLAQHHGMISALSIFAVMKEAD